MSDTATTQVQFTDLTAFKRDLLYAIRALEQEQPEPPKGLAVKHHLEADYDEELNHSRLYQNLDGLVDAGLLAKSKRDGRTNEYVTTPQARQMLHQRVERYAEGIGFDADAEPPQRHEQSDERPLVPTDADLTALFDGNPLELIELARDGTTLRHETEDRSIRVTLRWNGEFFTHASAYFETADELVALDLDPDAPDDEYVFIPTEHGHDFEVRLTWDDEEVEGGDGR